jgi:IS1 family transposase
VAYDPEHRLVIGVVPGKRNGENVAKAVEELKRRTDEETIELVVTDEYKPYKTAILDAYGEKVVPSRDGDPGRPRDPRMESPRRLNYATVRKARENGKVTDIEIKIIFGDEESVRAALDASSASNRVNTSFVERNNGTDRNRNARKARKTYCFSKNREIHEAVTYFTMYSYNFCWPVRTLREKGGNGKWMNRTPAMAAGLADHVWSLREWLAYPAVQRD